MSLEKLLAKINEKEQNKRNDLQAEYDVIFDKINTEFETEIFSYKASEEAAVNAKIDFLKQKEETDIEIEKRKQILNIKREILEEVYAEFTEALKKINDKDYKKWIESKIANLDIFESGTLVIGFKDVKLQVACNVEFDKDLGFGFLYKEGSTIVNYSLDTIISNLKAEHELELAKILF